MHRVFLLLEAGSGHNKPEENHQKFPGRRSKRHFEIGWGWHKCQQAADGALSKISEETLWLFCPRPSFQGGPYGRTWLWRRLVLPSGGREAGAGAAFPPGKESPGQTAPALRTVADCPGEAAAPSFEEVRLQDDFVPWDLADAEGMELFPEGGVHELRKFDGGLPRERLHAGGIDVGKRKVELVLAG